MIKKLAWLITVIAVSLFSGGVQAKASVEEMAYFLLSCMSEFEDQLVIDDMLTAFQVAASKQRNFDPARAKRDDVQIPEVGEVSRVGRGPRDDRLIDRQ